MGESLRALTPLILVGLCLVAWFEPWIPGIDALGDDVLLRFITGLLCLFALVHFVERRRLISMLEQVVGHLKQVRAGGPPGPRDRVEVAHEAMTILVAALDSQDASVRASAAQNLERLSGQKFGEDAARWRAFLAAQASPDASQESDSGLGESQDSP